jgi:hypothetical protein
MERILYNGRIRLCYEEGRHRYSVSVRQDPPLSEWSEPVRVPSVTSILSVVGSEGALVQWAANCASSFVASRLKPGMVLTQQDIDALAGGARMAHAYELDDAARIGTVVHDWIRRYIAADMPESFELPEGLRARAACEAARQWMDEVRYWPLLTETCLYSRKYGYAGTLDVVGMASAKGNASIVDWKTSKRIYPKHRMQTAAYAKAYSEMAGLRVRHRWIVRIGKEGDLEPLYLPPETLAPDFGAFLAAKDISDYLRRLEDGQGNKHSIR